MGYWFSKKTILRMVSSNKHQDSCRVAVLLLVIVLSCEIWVLRKLYMLRLPSFETMYLCSNVNL